MKLHSLRVTAFGPFAAEEQVDFDALSEGGLFLLHGPTGAGKTSVLDAVCFALYGQVPGARRTTLRLRSDHADATTAPEVCVEFSSGGRRFEVTRSPGWERPKRRGTGTTTQQARVAVRELVDGEWEVRTARVDEAAHLLEGVLGLGPDQFTKLVLLPQGEFAAFLRADGDERKALLEKLFGTDRYATVATWVRERRAAQRQHVDAAAERTRLLLARAEQAVEPLGVGAADARDALAEDAVQDRADDRAEQPAATVVDDASVRSRLAALRGAAAHAAERALTDRGAVQARLEAAAREHAEAVTLAGLRSGHARYAAARERLRATTAEAERLRIRLRAAEQAQPVAALVSGLEETARSREEAGAALAAVVGRIGPVPTDALPAAAPAGAPVVVEVADLGDAALRRAVDAARQRVGELAAVADDAAALVTLDAHAAAHRRAAVQARADHERLTTRQARSQTSLETARVRLAEVGARAGGRAAAVQAESAAQAVVIAVDERDRLTVLAADLTARATAAETAANVAMRAWLDGRRARLDGIAAELAAELTEDAPCPVCGGREHPARATAAPGGPVPVTADTEQRLHAAFEAADAVKESAAAHLARVREAVATAVAEAADRSPAAARADAAAARAHRESCEAAEREVDALTAQEARLVAVLDELTAAVAAAARRQEEADATVSRLEERAAGLRERVDRARGEDPSVAVRRNRLQAWADAAQTVLDHRRLLAEAARAHERATKAARKAARAAGFEDVDACVEALLPASDVAAGVEALRSHDDELAAVTSRLADPVIVAAAGAAEPRPAAAATRLEQARADEAAAARSVTLAEEAVRALDGITTDVETHLAACGPIVRRFAVLDGLSRCLDGTGGDNSRRMPLSAFVLAARLEQVAEAASLRLAQMSGGRFGLVHSDATEKGVRRTGLGLQVVDEWTGRHRDTASLSGGEAFYTSLALALGLADVVSAEAGGTTIETLFVDEGFGSLDEDTLEEVMDVLDALRSGGRVVGLVSHVADLRDRMPARLEVVKGRTGSRLRLEVAAS